MIKTKLIPNTFYTSIALLCFVHYNNKCNSEAQMRKQRFLHFPPQTNVVLTMALLKPLPGEKIVLTLTEFDVLFPVPEIPYDVNKRTKREINFEHILDDVKHYIQIISGDLCLRNMFCHLKSHAKNNVNTIDDVIKDILQIAFEPINYLDELNTICNVKMETNNNNCEISLENILNNQKNL